MEFGPKEHYLKMELYNLIKEDAGIFDFIQTGSLDGIWYWDLEKPENEWLSPKFWETLGYDYREMKHLSSEWKDIIFEDDLKVALENFQKHCEDPNHPYDQIVRYKHKNGSTVWIRCRGMAIRNAFGKPVRMLGAHTDITSLKTAEQRRIENENNFKVLLNGLPDLVYMYTKEDGGIFYSDNVEKILGYSAQYLYEHPFLWNESIHPNHKEPVNQAIKEFENGKMFDIEYQIKDSKGRWLWFHDRSIARKFENGKNIIFGLASDITNAKESEKELQKTKTHLSTLVESTQDMIWTVDFERFGFITFNSSLKNYLKDSPGIDIHPGMTPHEFLPPNIADEWVKRFKRAIEQGPYECEIETYEKDRNLILSFNLLKIEGKIYGISVFGKDITQRKKDEAKIRESEQKYKEVVENIPVGIATSYTEGQMYYVNDRLVEILGSPSREALLTVNYLNHPNLIQWGHADFHKKSLESGNIGVLEQEYESISGKKLYIRMVDSPIKDETGKVTGLVSIFEDYTEKIAAERELIQAKEKAEEANRAKSQFLANMSHEIRTPLNGIMGMIQLVLLSDLSPENREYLSVALSSANLLERVLSDVLEYSRIEARKIRSEIVPFDIAETIDDVIRLFQIPLKQKGLYLKVHVDERIPGKVIGEGIRIRQILANLIGNAIKFTETGGIALEVIFLDENPNEIKLQWCIRDTGIGISPAKQGYIFNRFEQVDPSNTRKYGGTGLGLAICKGLVELMEGEIWVESQEGQGSSFFFTCVLGKSDETSPDREIEKRGLGEVKTRKLKLLIVEDDETNLVVMSAFAKRRGWEVVSARNGKEAVAYCTTRAFDLIIMDIQMPELNGYEAAAEIRRMDQNKQSPTPIIAMTACALEGDREKCLEAGMDDYLSKPINVSDFYSIIEKWSKN